MFQVKGRALQSSVADAARHAVPAGGTSSLTRQSNQYSTTGLRDERSPLGGDCTFTGCVPSKTLLAAAAQGLDFGAAENADAW